jgi:hypothetical protein
MLELNRIRPTKITGTPELVTVDFLPMFNELYRSSWGNEAAIALGTTSYKGNSYPLPFVLMKTLVASLEHQESHKTL